MVAAVDRLGSGWPTPADAGAAAVLAERLDRAGAAVPGARRGPPARGATTAAAVAAIGGNSPFLADLAVREEHTFGRLLDGDAPGAVAAEAIAAVGALDPRGPRPALARALRTARRRVALAVAFGDLGGALDLAGTTALLSGFAVAALGAAVAHLLDGMVPGAPDASGFVVLGMGKLGGGELNYSSDVDLVLLYDPARGVARSLDDANRASRFAQLARDLVALMEARDADGYVFRTDLRLRPDPGATRLAVAIPAALTYYEALAETWERAAFIRARPVAGDLALGDDFLRAIEPFTWRRSLDFSAIDDMRAMKARIDRFADGDGAARGGAAAAADPVGVLLGRDLKRGRGGIREIEFVAQTLQLLWGGRDRALRSRNTVEALEALAAAGHLPADAAASLADGYRVLRRVEHRLQMVADRQTHALPADRAGFDRFAPFAGAADGPALARALLAVTEPVAAAFAATVGDGSRGGAPAERSAASFDAAALAGLGFRDAAGAAALLARLGNTPPRALRTPRARALHALLLEPLLGALGHGRDPDRALARWCELLERLPASVGLLSLLARNDGLLRRIAVLLGAAPVIADTLALAPEAIEGLLVSATADRSPGRTLARLLLARPDPRALETAIETARRFVRAEEFRLALAELEDRLDIDAIGRARTALAEAVVRLLLDRVRRDFRARHGTIRGGGLAVVVLGKAGSRRMIAGSDLDLMLLYDHPSEAGPSDGTRPLAPAPYFGRLAQRFVAALTAPGRDGPLYRCDMRLRPSGRAGPVAVSLGALIRYQAEAAWTWERMALTRARAVAGPVPLRRAIGAALAAALAAPPRPGTAPLADAHGMRARLLRDRPPDGPDDIRLRVGGLMEVEFIAQALQLGPAAAGARRFATDAAFRALARAGLLALNDAIALTRADRHWRRAQSRERLLGPAPDPAADAIARDVHDRFERLLGRGEPDGSGPPPPPPPPTVTGRSDTGGSSTNRRPGPAPTRSR